MHRGKRKLQKRRAKLQQRQQWQQEHPPVAADEKPAAEKKRAAKKAKAAVLAAAGSASTQTLAAALAVIHEDEHLIAINKPAGLLCHPSPGFWEHGTVVHALGARERTPGYSELGAHMLEARRSYTGEADSFIPRAIVHRLDRHTTGVMLVAKTELAEVRRT